MAISEQFEDRVEGLGSIGTNPDGRAAASPRIDDILRWVRKAAGDRPCYTAGKCAVVVSRLSRPITASEEELERFFGVSALRSDADVPWPYVGVTFEASRDRFSVQCVISPSCRDVQLQLHWDGQLLYQLVSPILEDVRVHADPAHDTLEIVVSRDESIFIRLYPSVLITQRTWDGT